MYKSIEICVDCEHELTDNQRMYNNGVCPHCGYKGRSSVTISDSETIIYKEMVSTYTKYWVIPYYKIDYVGKTDYDQQWLIKNNQITKQGIDPTFVISSVISIGLVLIPLIIKNC